MNKSDRVLRISQKINSFQVHNIAPVTEEINKQLDSLMFETSTLEKEHKKQCQFFQQQIEQISFESKDKENWQEQKENISQNEIEIYKEKILSLLQQNQQSRKEAWKKIQQVILSRFEQLKGELEINQSQWKTDFDQYSAGVKNTIEELKQNQSLWLAQKKDQLIQIQNEFNQQANEISETIQKEEAKIQEDKQKYEEIVNDLRERIVEEIIQEKMEWEEHEDHLLNLLENTCEKIQTVIA